MVKDMTGSAAPTSTRRDDSWFGVALVAAALVGVTVAVIGLWLPVARHAPLAVEQYFPIPNGASFIYRVTHPDGSVTYRSRNIRRARANEFVTELTLETLAALEHAANIDILQVGIEAANEQLSKVEVAQATNVEYDARGETLHRTTTLFFPQNDQISMIGVNAVGIEPPLPFLETGGTPKTVLGKLSNGATYSTTLTLETRGSLDSLIGTLNDCLVVRQSLTVNDALSTSRTWYCAGLGETRDETQDADGTTKSELIGISAGDVVRGGAETIPASDVQASLQAVFPIPLQGELKETLHYKEPAASVGISSRVLPVNELLLYGTQSGALVALNRAEAKEMWRFQMGGAIYGAPMVSNGIVYIGSADKKVYALRVADGSFLWAFKTRDIVSSTPASSGDTVYVASEDRTLYALDADTGRKRWAYSAPSPLVASPIVSEGSVYVSSDDGTLHALDAATGAVRWKFTAGDAIAAPVAVRDDVVYVGSYDATLYALDAASGAQSWKRELGSEIFYAPVVMLGRVYVTLADELVALDAQSGAIVWNYSSQGRFAGAPLVLGNQLWLTRSGDLVAVDAANGAVLQTVPTEESYAEAASSDGQRLFLGHFDRVLQSFEGATR